MLPTFIATVISSITAVGILYLFKKIKAGIIKMEKIQAAFQVHHPGVYLFHRGLRLCQEDTGL